MVQKLIININANKPLDSYGDGHMLIYDATKKEYFVTSREAFLSPQNNKIKELEQKVDAFIKKIEVDEKMFEKNVHEELDSFEKNVHEELGSFEENVKLEIQKFEKEIHEEIEKFESEEKLEVNEFKINVSEKFDDFLKRYQETNAKLIKMVKKVITEEQ